MTVLTFPRSRNLDDRGASRRQRVEEGQEIKPSQTVAILEAMKLEIAVKAPEDQKRAKVEKLLVTPGETVRAGGRIALLRSL